jgi:uncharacterized repeat protein (TIGR01451 family)
VAFKKRGVKMKKNLGILLGILILGTMSADASENRFEVSSVFTFDYLKAGESNIPLSFKIDNKSSIKLENIFAKLVLGFPFSPSTLARKELRSDLYKLDDVEPYTSKNAQFKIDVSESAKYGDYPVNLVVSYDDPADAMYRIEELFPFTIHVTGETLLEVTKIEMLSEKNIIRPGDRFKLNVNVKNIGDNKIEWLKISVLLQSEIIPTSPDQRIFKNLQKWEEVKTSYEFSTEKNSIPQNYSIKMIMEYKDEAGKTFSETRFAGVEVKGEAQMDIASVATNPTEVKAGDSLTLTVRVENAGTVAAKSVKVTIDMPFSGTKEAFLGEIKKGEDAPAVFMLKAGEASEYKYNLTIEYEDDLGTHTKKQELLLVVYPNMGNNTYTYVLAGAGLLILVVAGYFFLRRARSQ